MTRAVFLARPLLAARPLLRPAGRSSVRSGGSWFCGSSILRLCGASAVGSSTVGGSGGAADSKPSARRFATNSWAIWPACSGLWLGRGFGFFRPQHRDRLWLGGCGRSARRIGRGRCRLGFAGGHAQRFQQRIPAIGFSRFRHIFKPCKNAGKSEATDRNILACTHGRRVTRRLRAKARRIVPGDPQDERKHHGRSNTNHGDRWIMSSASSWRGTLSTVCCCRRCSISLRRRAGRFGSRKSRSATTAAIRAMP